MALYKFRIIIIIIINVWPVTSPKAVHL